MTNNIKKILIYNSIFPNEKNIDRYIKFINYCKTILFSGYTETHHIIPKSFNGSNESFNLIRLSARHHFIAHLLLAKSTNNPKMIKALHKMVFSINGDVKRNYKISNRVYAYLREEHAKIVSLYSKNTVVARNIDTKKIKRIPKQLFDEFNGTLYEAISKGRKDSQETKIKKSIASNKSRKVIQNSGIRKLAASKYSYQTPKGFCQSSNDLKKLYPSFTKNTLTVINNDSIISNKFASIHKEFIPFIGKTFSEYGIKKTKRY